MPIVVTPEVGIPLPFDTSPEEITEFRERAHALFETVQELAAQGMPIEIDEADKVQARALFTQSKTPAVKTATPGAIIHLEAMLSEWDQEILDVGRRLRSYVTNKLIAETADPDPRVRLKSLELLGKVSNVGLFSERVDITVTHRTINDIEADLKKTLELFTGEVVDVTPLDEVGAKSLADIDLDEELGPVPPPDAPAELQEQ